MPNAAFALTVAGLTDVGRTRSRNEDNFQASTDAEFAVVCDGMGGHAGGDIASRKAVEVISGILLDYVPSDPIAVVKRDDADRTQTDPAATEPAVRHALSVARSAVQQANRTIHELNLARGFSSGRGMGTTVAGIWRIPGTAQMVVFHAGDSRVYRLRDGELRPLTRDHSLYQMWLDNGGRGTAPQRNIIVRALGTAEDVEPEVGVQPLMPDDVVMLCSDGLNGMLPDGVIARILRQESDPALAAAALVDAANAAGGMDNVTVVVGRFTAIA
ncbi:protein phosphatase [Azospirillum lipoferum]|uniref:Serine/threonine-protein phosphatase n=1 Tax=Azospirillum lipoferum TaxID=193 RepID=A0A5A9GFT1_AZOLI|nr:MULTISPECIES: protein phosphatase 2C domain-containing protein [Azospirillum]KAA0592552.1 serine/threonine-protein phosphatase [Azospirillum lipoferum]MCP1614459.1 protein phosphatase [Azospirillum lipoferum]MDW5532709.1 protein phosphatase 2C domain-containing protein [Azospirillum sp. NL1]